MSAQKTLKLCRLLVAVLLFNIAVPVLQAGESGPLGYTLICTSAGLVKVSLDDLNGELSQAGTASSDHCPYCKLLDLPLKVNASLLPYPAPDSNLALNYQSILAAPVSLHLLRHEQLRAPPIYL